LTSSLERDTCRHQPQIWSRKQGPSRP